MNSQKLLIVSIIAALLILGGAVAFVKYRNAGPSSAPAAPQSDHVTIEEALTTCTEQDQCIVVDTTCSFCCKYAAINSKNEALFNQLFDQTCKKYSGTYCECHDLGSYPSCVNGKCQMVNWSENKALKVPPVPGSTPVPAPSPAPTPVAPAVAEPVTPAPAPEVVPAPATEPIAGPVPEAAPEAFGEEEPAPLAEEPAPEAPPEAAPVPDDLYEPLPDSYPLPTEENGAADVVQP